LKRFFFFFEIEWIGKNCLFLKKTEVKLPDKITKTRDFLLFVRALLAWESAASYSHQLVKSQTQGGK
jgi:hypothetical protein